MAENLLRDAWAKLDQADLRLLLQESIGRPGQYDGDRDTIHLPLAREQCRLSLTYDGSKIVSIKPGAAFDRGEWSRICEQVEYLLSGPKKVGREFSFSSYRVKGWWRGERSGVQILPPPDNAPRASLEMADHPFILEFPIQDSGNWPVTNQRRIREHRRFTLLLNVLLNGTTSSQPDRNRGFWANISLEAPEVKWVQRWFFADLGVAVADALLPPSGEKLEVVEAEKYYREGGHDGRGLRAPDDLDEQICRYQNLAPVLQAKFDRATYWLSMASLQWDDSMSASYASLVSSAEALTNESSKHSLYCGECKKNLARDVPGATEKFRNFFEKYTPDPGLKQRRSKMYALRSGILHGSTLMQLDQGRALGWDPPWWNEREMHGDLWALMQIAARNWLKDPA